MRHQLIGEDNCLACLTCGAHYCEGREADYSQCSGDTRMVHGYAGERVCWHGAHGSILVSEAAGDKCEHMALSDDCDCDLCN